MSEELQYLKSQVQVIEAWLAEYEGSDENLINRKLDEQEGYLKQIADIRKCYLKSQ